MRFMNTIKQVIKMVGAQEIAEACDVSVQAVYKWARKQVPAERCPSIEQLTKGKIRCADLRPDVFANIRKAKK